MKYYILLYKYNGKRRYLIWIGADQDALVVDARGFIPSFSTVKSLRLYAKRNGYIIEKEKPILHDLDVIAAWLKQSDKSPDCKAVLTAWNLFSDIAASFPKRTSNFKKMDRKFPQIYNKVFWGNNLPPMTPEGEEYRPKWSRQELKVIRLLMQNGLDLFVRETNPWAS